MARPKKEPFFEVELPRVLSETEKWLYTFHCNSKMLVEYMLKNGKNLANQVYEVPQEIDDAVSRLKLNGAGLKIDVLTAEQEAYMNDWRV